MKKMILMVVAAIVAVTATYAQGSLLATLSHEGNISVFYGSNALKSAVTAAANGDVITLSSGQFNAVDITKNITLRGAGINVSTDSLNLNEPTMILGSFSINVAETVSGRLAMEGLYFSSSIIYSGTLKNAQFLKCRFRSLYNNGSAVMTNTSFIHCRFYDGFKMDKNSSSQFINCIVCRPTSRESNSTIEFDNCFIKFDGFSNQSYGDAAWANRVQNAYYKNCIIQCCQNISYNTIYGSCINCIGLGGYSQMFSYMTNSTNKFVSSISSLFKTYNVTNTDTYINDSWSFELTEEAIQTYLGTDGTQVGIYGGNLPYDENSTIPQITKCNVASKSTADGKLSVDITVNGAE